MDVFFYEAFEEEAAALRAALPPEIRAGFAAATAQAAGHEAPPAPLVSMRTQSRIPDAWVASLRGIVARTTGYDHLLDLRGRAPPTLQLACLPEYCSRAVAEQAALLWLALLRRLPVQQRQWAHFHRDGLTGAECAGRTLVVVGVGRIGHEVVRIGRGLDMRVIGVDPVRRHGDVEYAGWADASQQADVIVAAMNLTADNAAFFRAETLARVPRGCLFVNVARGELVATGDLPALLQDGTLGGVALDVFEDEPRVADALRGVAASAPPGLDALRALAARTNVILTPHNAFNTGEALRRKAELTARQVASFVATGRFAWPLAT